MCKIQLLACLLFVLALLATGAPTARSTRDMEQHLEQLLLDLQGLKGALENKSSTFNGMSTFPFYLPKKATELRHLQCLAEELKALEQVLSLAENKHIKELMSNIKVTVQELKGSETMLPCEYEEETVNIVELLDKWISICQSIYSPLA